ncbi:MAG: ABC transporter permease subunit, partial [Pararhodobacter sp.]
MFSYCSDPSQLEGLVWLSCYLTSATHLLFYASFGTVFLLLALTAPAALALGYAGALASRSQIAPLRWFGKLYTSMVRGIPDVLFFLFVPIALDQGLEWLRHQVLCDSDLPVRQGNDFVVCAAAKLPLSNAEPWVHNAYGLMMAVIAFSVVFGAFAAKVLYGALQAVPRAQLETAEAYGMSPRQVTRRVL